MTPHSGATLKELDLPQDLVRLFRSFGIPTNVQRATLISVMDDCEKEILSHTDNHPAGAQLEDVSQEPYRSQCRIKALQSLFAPIRSLPSEIHVEIFRLFECLPPPRNSTSNRDSPPELNRPIPSPFTLMAVCSFWRTTVISHPVLWSRMTITAEGDCYAGVRVQAAKVEGIRSWMDRIGNHPWSLSIDATLTSQSAHHVPLSDVLRHPATSQLCKLRVDADASITGVEKATFPALESLIIRWAVVNSPMMTLETVFPVVSNLKKLVVVNVTNLNTITDKLPWATLTHIFIGGITMQKWLMIIGQCRSLRRACFSLEAPSQHIAEFFSGEEHATLITLPHLTQLTLLNRPPLHHHLEQVSLPSLEELNILYGTSTFQECNTSTLHSFHNVTRLTIAGRQRVDVPRTIFKVFEATPMVTDLTLNIRCKVEELFRFLIFDPLHQRLSFLERLDVSCNLECDTYGNGLLEERREFPLTEIGDFIRSRSRARNSGRRSDNSRSLRKVIIRLPETDSSPWTLASVDILEAMAHELRAERDIQVSIAKEPDPNGDLSLPKPEELLDGYKHWDEGLMDFLTHSH